MRDRNFSYTNRLFQFPAGFRTTMKVLWSSLLIGTFVAAASACTEGDSAAIDGKCREYQVCKNGSWVIDSCNRPLSKYSKEQKKCMWWFQVDCVESTQCSTEGELRKNPYTCSSYYKCSSSKLEVHRCLWPFYFDGKACKFWGDCESSGVGEKYAEQCSDGEAEPIADSCRQYKTCRNGFFEETSCWWGKRFDVESKSCQWFWKVNCDLATCDGKPRAAESSDGKTYYQCVDKFLMKKSCGLLKRFDKDQGRCVYSVIATNLKEVNDAIRSEEADKAFKNVHDLLFTSVAEAGSSKTADSALNKSSSVSIKRVLRSVSNSYLTDTSCTDGSTQADLNCLKYKVCIGNAWVTRTCPDGMIFSSNMCQWSWDSQCNPGSCIVGQKSAYTPDCTKYNLCDQNNNEVVTSCPESWYKKTHFNPSTGNCDWVTPWADCPSSSSGVTCSEGQTTEGNGAYEFQICSNGKWVTVKCTGSDVYKKDLHGCGCSKEAEHRAAQNSKQYLECQGGRWIQLDCLLGGVFNPTTKVCEKPRSRRSVEAPKNPNDCISGDTKADVINGVCSTYMFCTENGKWARRACPVGEYYNGHNGCGKDLCPYTPVPGNCEMFVTGSGIKETCDFGYRFDSTTKQCVPFAQATCLDIECEGTEKKNHPTSCAQYLQCHDQQWETKECGWFHDKFDMRSRECVFGWWGHKAVCRYDPAKCMDGSQTPVAGECRRYLTCTDGREQEGSCMWPKKFNESSSSCVWWGAKCA